MVTMEGKYHRLNMVLTTIKSMHAPKNHNFQFHWVFSRQHHNKDKDTHLETVQKVCKGLDPFLVQLQGALVVQWHLRGGDGMGRRRVIKGRGE